MSDCQNNMMIRASKRHVKSELHWPRLTALSLYTVPQVVEASSIKQFPEYSSLSMTLNLRNAGVFLANTHASPIVLSRRHSGWYTALPMPVVSYDIHSRFEMSIYPKVFWNFLDISIPIEMISRMPPLMFGESHCCFGRCNLSSKISSCWTCSYAFVILV